MNTPDTTQSQSIEAGALHIAKRRLLEMERIIGENIHLFDTGDQEDLTTMIAGQKYFFAEFCSCTEEPDEPPEFDDEPVGAVKGLVDSFQIKVIKSLPLLNPTIL